MIDDVIQDGLKLTLIKCSSVESVELCVLEMKAMVVRDLFAYRRDLIDFFLLKAKSPLIPSTAVSSTSLITSTDPRRVKFDRKGVAK